MSRSRPEILFGSSTASSSRAAQTDRPAACRSLSAPCRRDESTSPCGSVPDAIRGSSRYSPQMVRLALTCHGPLPNPSAFRSFGGILTDGRRHWARRLPRILAAGRGYRRHENGACDQQCTHKSPIHRLPITNSPIHQLRFCCFPFPPPARFAQAERVPPLIERSLVETHDGLARDGGRHRHARASASTTAARSAADARDEMPERHRVARSRRAARHDAGGACALAAPSVP